MICIADTIKYFMNACRDLPPEDVVFGDSEAMQVIRLKVEKVAGTNLPVLIRGEVGTGKEIMARLIHRRSPGEDAPFFKLNCPIARGGLLEEIGFETEGEGLDSPADRQPAQGETPRRATLFLEEVADLDASSQFKLLQMMQEDQAVLVGRPNGIPVDLRVISATIHHLERETEFKNFRRDLFYSINVVTLNLPPLRERRMDIRPLVDYFLEIYNRKFGCQACSPSTQLMRLLERHDWPGNIRELEYMMKRYVLLGSEEIITAELSGYDQRDLASEPASEGAISLKKVTREVAHELERRIILKALQENHGNRKQAARNLNISYRALLYKIKEAGVPPKRFQIPKSTAKIVTGDRPKLGPSENAA